MTANPQVPLLTEMWEFSCPLISPGDALKITQILGATLIEIAATCEDLTRLSWVQASTITANDFSIV